MKLVLTALFLFLPLLSRAAVPKVDEGCVGLVLETTSDSIFVQSVIKDSPAANDGSISPGDMLLAVQQDNTYGADWLSIKGMPLTDAVELIRGEVGTKVGLEFSSGDNVYSVILTRAPISQSPDQETVVFRNEHLNRSK